MFSPMPFRIARVALLAFALLVDTAESATKSLRVLFVGNSFTSAHDLPGQLQNIAASLGDHVTVNHSCIGGCTLYAQGPQFSEETSSLMDENWDYIVLQDHSMLPTLKEARDIYMGPAIDDFVARKK